MSRESTHDAKIEKKAFFIGTCRRRSYYNMYPSDYLEDMWSVDVRRLAGYKSNIYTIKPKEILPEDLSTTVSSEKGKIDLYYIPEGGSVDKFEFKRAYKLDRDLKEDTEITEAQLIYQAGSYYRLDYEYTENQDFYHSIYVYCVNVVLKGSNSMTKIVGDNPITVEQEPGLTLKRFEGPIGDLASLLGRTADTECEETDVMKVQDIDMINVEHSTATTTPPADNKILYNSDYYSFDGKGEINKMEEKELNFNEEGLQFLIAYNFPNLPMMQILKRMIQVESSESNKKKNTMLTKFKDLRHPYQFTAEKYKKLEEAVKFVAHEQDGINQLQAKLQKYDPEGSGPDDREREDGGSYDKSIAVVNLDTKTYDLIEELKTKIDYLYNNVRLKTNYQYDSVKWLSFITKYIVYHKPLITMTETPGSPLYIYWNKPIYEIRKELLASFKRYNMSDIQRSELYCYDFFDKNFYKLIEFDINKPINSRKNVVLKVKKYFIQGNGAGEYKTENEAKTAFTEAINKFYSSKNSSASFLSSFTGSQGGAAGSTENINIHEYDTKNFGVLWNRRNDFKFKNDDKKYYQIEMNQDGLPEGYDDTNNRLNKELGWTNKAGSSGVITDAELTFVVAGKGDDYDKQSSGIFTGYSAEKRGKTLGEHILNKIKDQKYNNAIIGMEWWYGSQLKGEEFLESLGVSRADRKGQGEEGFLGDNYGEKITRIGGGKYTKTHKKRKTLKKRPSRKRR